MARQRGRNGSIGRSGRPLSVYRFVPVESWDLLLGSELLSLSLSVLDSARERHQSTGHLILESDALSFEGDFGNPWGSCSDYHHIAFAKSISDDHTVMIAH